MTAGRLASTIVWIYLSALVTAPLTAWAAMALWFRLPAPEWTRAAAAGVFVIVALATVWALFTRRRWVALSVFALVFGAVVVWWGSLEPPADGDWAPDVARQTTGTLDGDILTLSDVRDFDWVTDNDFSERWSKRSYDLSKLETLDLFLAYWGGPQMAHLIMSFGFDGGEKLSWSVEVRREKTGQFSPIADAFKSHALVYLATSERDSVRLRSNVRGEDVRLYRLRASPEAARTVLLQYVAEANELAERPAFYNSLTTNCTTAVVKLIRAAGGSLPLDWRLIVNGYLPGYLYDRGAVVTTIPLSDLIALARIDERARAADKSPEFSRLIRVGVPSPFDQAKQ
ncbi:MAG: DUF4105 domain-containing protein [Hyphomicrobiales bacterium]|nr:DUF4105 domain-containing protein [Hyphomicrobiales bacterium]